MFQDGLKRPLKPQALQAYVQKYKAAARDQVDVAGALPPQMAYAAALQLAQSRLATEAIDAHEILRDVASFERAHLCYRPVSPSSTCGRTPGRSG